MTPKQIFHVTLIHYGELASVHLEVLAENSAHAEEIISELNTSCKDGYSWQLNEQQSIAAAPVEHEADYKKAFLQEFQRAEKYLNEAAENKYKLTQANEEIRKLREEIERLKGK
jgi:hypothetical protein